MSDAGIADPIETPAADAPPASEPPADAPVNDGAGDPPPSDPPAGEGAAAEPKPGEMGHNSAGTPFYQGVEDWRKQTVEAMGLEGEDADKEIKRMERFSDFASYAKSAREAIAKIGRGEISTGLPENPTDEQLAEYREANGIPAEPAGYELKVPDGTVLNEADQRIIDGIKEDFHAGNISAESFDQIGQKFLELRNAETTRTLELDRAKSAECKSTLIEIYGSEAEYNANLNVLSSCLAGFPEDVREAFEGGRLADGSPIFANPSIVRTLVDMQRKINPAATVVPNSANAMADIKSEISRLEARMGTDEWYKDEAAQKRLQDLYAAEEQMQRNAA